MKKLSTILILLLTWNICLIGQELQFSQFYTTSVLLNPAFSAVFTQPSIIVNYRSPVVNEAVANETSLISVIYPVINNPIDNFNRGGVGVMAYTNSSGFNGVLNTTGMMVNYAHNLYLNTLGSEILAVGVQVGYENINVSFAELRWGSSYNPFLGFDPNSPVPSTEFNDAIGHVIVNAGVMYYFNRQRNFLLHNISAFSGIAVSNINRPDKSLAQMGENKVPMLFKYHGGVEMQVGKFNVLPNVLAQYQNGSTSFDAGFYMWYGLGNDRFQRSSKIQLVAGAWYRLKDSFIALAGLNYDRASVKLSYDFNSSSIFSGNSSIARNHAEISLQYNFSRNSAAKNFSNPLF